jgi:ubiquinone/menaquinone biosynthesis C-methylase UbiE
MSPSTLKLLRASRNAVLFALRPLDYLSRSIHNRTELPPLHLRRYVGPIDSFESSGVEFMTHLRQIVGLQPQERILDIGCGCGQMALQLKDYLGKKGSYVGVDIHEPSINWCQKKIASKHGNFQFVRIDVRNLTYNPEGAHAAEAYQFPFADGSFDLVLLKSVFTHMRPAEVSNYLKEVTRLLNAQGRCVATFFLLNDEQSKLANEGLNKIAFDFGEGVWRYRYEHSAESAVAYDEGFVRQSLNENGLVLKQLNYGSWSGRKGRMSYQDILLIAKR